LELGVDVARGSLGDTSAERRERRVERTGIRIGYLRDHDRDARLEIPADVFGMSSCSSSCPGRFPCPRKLSVGRANTARVGPLSASTIMPTIPSFGT
jgi:hypothetical protein